MNLTDYVRLQPDDARTLLALYRQKYFVEENSAEIDVDISKSKDSFDVNISGNNLKIKSDSDEMSEHYICSSD